VGGEFPPALLASQQITTTLLISRLSQGDFQRAARTEPHLIGWLDALGGVF
jgi:hypothetical protein